MTQAAIVEAATRILERDGYPSLTTNRVAAVAGVCIASLYDYFPNKQAVVAAVVTSTVDDVVAELEAALTEALELYPEDGLATWVSAMFAALDKRRRLSAVLLKEVPFLYEIPAIRALRPRLFALAARGRGLLGPSFASLERLEAMTYLLPLMVSSGVLDAVVRPPKGIARADIEHALVDVLRPLVAAG